MLDGRMLGPFPRMGAVREGTRASMCARVGGWLDR